MGMQDELRRLPGVDRLLGEEMLAAASARYGRALTTDVTREELSAARVKIQAGGQAPTVEDVTRAVLDRLADINGGTLHPVINATGVILHTNLGRAPLSRLARQSMDAVAASYSNLEYDLAAGTRGSRHVHAEALLCRLTGAEAAMVVSNNAAAVYLILLALAGGKEVIVSRSQLVEIGGGFRIPDIMRQSGARLVEVGTTNRTHARDYREAIGPETALMLRVHFSNFRQTGFTSEVPLAEMVALGQELHLPVVDDVGSGTLLDTSRYGLSGEPLVQDSVAAGAALVCFSGDKLLGGPQAGLIVGQEALVARLRSHPLARALRVGKGTLAALQATLLHYVRGEAEREVPVWRMISTPLDALMARAADWAADLRARNIPATVLPATSTIGGGSLPGEVMPTRVLAVAAPLPDALAARLRLGRPAVVARIIDDQVVFDPRTVQPGDDPFLLQAIEAAWNEGRGTSDE